jgi:hypothetical protein
MSRPILPAASPREKTMNHPVLLRIALHALRLMLALGVVVLLGGVRSPTLDILFEQFQIIGPWQWLSLITVGAPWPRLKTPRIRLASASRPARAALAPANDNSPADLVARAS